MSWSVEGTYFENCNCDFACPCSVTSFAAPATQDRCNVVLAYHIQRGQIDGVDVSGHSVAVVADAPAKMLDGNWRVKAPVALIKRALEVTRKMPAKKKAAAARKR